MMKLFKKKQAVVPTIPVDKSFAIQGFTKAIEKFANAQKKIEPDFIPIYLYVLDKKTNMSICFLEPTFFARNCKNPKPGFSIFFNKTMLESRYEAFEVSEVAKYFCKEKGVIDSPGHLHEKCEFYIRDFGYDSEEASAVIAMLLQDVFHIKSEDVSLSIQVFGWNDEMDGQESTTDFDYVGNVIASSGFKHDLF